MKIFWALLVAFGGTCLLLWVLRPLALRIGLVDQPGGRKLHSGSVALAGGIAMLCGLMFSALLLETSLAGFRTFFAGCALLLIIGVLDDFHELPTWPRFVAQFLAALMMVFWGGVVVTDLGAITGVGDVQLGYWAIPFTILATIGVINAWNMSDGVDGLSGGLALIAFLVLGYIATTAGRVTDGQLLFLLATVVGAFLLFNVRFPRRHQALVFMGDAGSMFLGFALVWFAISLSHGEQRAMTPVTALWILALPLIDAVSILILRLLGRRSPFSAARDHLHHVLLSMGLSVNTVVVIMVGTSLVLSVVGLLALYGGFPESLLFFGFLALFALHFWLTGSLTNRNYQVGTRNELGRAQKLNMSQGKSES